MTNASTLNPSTINPSSIHNECLGVVLAGGLSSRMGRDKAQLLRGEKSLLSMLDFSKQTLLDSGINNIVVSGDNYDVPDKIKLSGPVGGILSVLAKYPHVKSLLILPVDLPFMSAKALADLRMKGELSQKATFFEDHNIPLYLPNNSYVELFLAQAFTKVSNSTINNPSNNRSNNPSNIRSNNSRNNTGERSRLGTERQKKGPSIKALLEQIPHQAIKSSDANILFNTNTPEQWQQAKQQLNF